MRGVCIERPTKNMIGVLFKDAGSILGLRNAELSWFWHTHGKVGNPLLL